MNIFFSHSTALRFFNRCDYPGRDTPIMELVDCAYKAKDLDALVARANMIDRVAFGSDCIDILTPSASMRGSRARYNYHVHTSTFPSRAFMRIAPNLYVVSPELCFIQAASRADIVDSALIGSQLCATYRIDESSATSISKRNPLATKASIRETIGEMYATASSTKLRTACSHIIESSASPMETKMALILTLPYRYGGYGFPFPQMNMPIDLTAQEQANSLLGFARGDAVWPEAKLDLEYDSSAFHTNEKRADDELRKNTLIHAGYTVISVTPNQLTNIERFEQIVEIIAPLLCKQIHRKDKGRTPGRIALFRRLFPWVRTA